MQQLPPSANCTVTTKNSVCTLAMPTSLEQGPITCYHASQNLPSTAEATRANEKANPFLLPGNDEVVRRVWNCEQNGKFVVKFFDIWKAEVVGHFAFCVYEADTLKPITRPQHPIQAAVLHLLVETELVPHIASIPFIVKTGKQVDRVAAIGGI